MALNDSYLAEKDEDAIAEELGEAEENEQEEMRTAEDLRTLRRHKENLIWRKNQELDNFLHDPNLDEKKREALKRKIKDLNKAIQENDEEERVLERDLGQKRVFRLRKQNNLSQPGKS